MIIITEKEVSNDHGTGVLLRNIIDSSDRKDTIVLSKIFVKEPDTDLEHHLFDDLEFYRGNKYVRKLMLSGVGASLYFSYKKPRLSSLAIYKHKTVLITIYSFDLLWIALKFMRLFPEKRYVVFIMDLFIEFGDDKEGRLNRAGFRKLSEIASVTFAISSTLCDHLKNISGVNYTPFFGPRIINWSEVESLHKKVKDAKMCLVGNAWVESVLPTIDRQLADYGITITWFTNQKKFDDVQRRYSLKSFVFGGNFPSDEVPQRISSFRFGLIIYGSEEIDSEYYSRFLQRFSIPSKIIDYCIAGIEPIYYGPKNTACFQFMEERQLGKLMDTTTADAFFGNFNKHAEEPLNLESMRILLQESGMEHFKAVAGI